MAAAMQTTTIAQVGAPSFRTDEIERFHRHVTRADANDCWPWTGELNNQGYGRFVIYRGGGRQRFLAHRVAYMLATGASLSRTTVVRHRCDNPPCCNPAHHLTGTQADNVRDAADRGRMNLGGLTLGRVRLPGERRLRKTCPDGHEWVEGSYRVRKSNGSRCCLICERARARERYRMRQERAS